MNMTPMIDVTFLLLIFFMTVSQVSKLNREQLELPRQQGTEEQQPSILTVNVNQTGQLIVGGTVYHLSELISLLGDEISRLGDDPSRVTVVLRADRRVPSEFVNRTVEALTRLDIRKVRIPVQVPD